MTDLLFTEKDLVTSLKDYIRAEESRLRQLKQYVHPLVVFASVTHWPEQR